MKKGANCWYSVGTWDGLLPSGHHDAGPDYDYREAGPRLHHRRLAQRLQSEDRVAGHLGVGVRVGPVSQQLAGQGFEQARLHTLVEEGGEGGGGE